MNTFISVIIPVYNGEKTISKCIESLVHQGYPKDKYEIIIVDNNSRDKTAEIVRKYPIRYIKEEKTQSAYASRNAGMKCAKGDILAFTDSDCVASPDWLRNGIEGFRGANIGCVAGGIECHEPQGYVGRYLCKRKIISQEENPPDMPLPYAKTANAFYARGVFAKIGFFEEKWISGGDADYSWRMQLETKYNIKFCPDAVIFHKHRSTVLSMFNQCVKWGIGYISLYKKYPEKMPKRTLRQTVWVLRRIAYGLMKMILFFFHDKGSMPGEKMEEYLDFIAFTGWEVGRIAGSVKNRVFYI
ncbi:MAG: glycosyltransferase [Candidatus Omnitrophica bacterium]|nr:glycosyltransferase [Candidatus Omnitrophota bacterium]